MIEISHEECYLLCYSAVRYALGRRTYVVNRACNTVRRLSKHLTAQEIDVIIRDIEERSKLGYGDDYDERNWMVLLVHLKAEREAKS